MPSFSPTSFAAQLKPYTRVTIISVIIITLLSTTGVVFYYRSQKIMEEQLKDKLKSTAAAAAMQFSGEEIDRIRGGMTIRTSPTLEILVDRLNNVRMSITNVRFAYIMRRTADPNMHEFVADADLALADRELDTNGNGTVDEDEAPAEPGEPYDWTEFPVLGKEAFLHPAVDPHIGSDQWGPIISGYAPIYRKDGSVAGILGIDMAASDYVALSQSIFSPVAVLLFLVAVMAIGSSSMMSLRRRRTEALERLETERTGLLRLAFHQLGAPLTIISWSLQELEEEGSASLQRTVANIQEGVKRLTGILKMLKDADIVHAGKIEYKPETASLSTVLEHVVKESGAKIAIRKQKVETRLSENITMNMDPKLIAGVAEELLSNAIDFSPIGATIVLSSKKDGKFAEFSVQDFGAGIPKSDLTRVFSEFTRGSNANKFKADGNGLGLYIVRGIVDRAGGKVTIESEEGKGTTVTVKLPLA